MINNLKIFFLIIIPGLLFGNWSNYSISKDSPLVGIMSVLSVALIPIGLFMVTSAVFEYSKPKAQQKPDSNPFVKFILGWIFMLNYPIIYYIVTGK